MDLEAYKQDKTNYQSMSVGGKLIKVLVYNTVRDIVFYWHHALYTYKGKTIHCMSDTKAGLKKDLTSSIIELLCD